MRHELIPICSTQSEGQYLPGFPSWGKLACGLKRNAAGMTVVHLYGFKS